MIKIYLLISFLGMVFIGFGQIFDNNCSSTPTGWTMEGSQQSDYYLLDNNNNNPEYVISHTMDLSNYTNLSLVLNLRSDGNGAKPSCLIEISDDGGSTWTAGTETITKIIAAYINYTWSIGTVNSSTVKIRWSDSNSNGRKLRINNLELTGTVSSGPNDPNTFSATVNSTTQIDLVFTTNGNGDNVVIVYDTDGTFSTPSGAPPAAGGPFAGGTVVYNGTTSPQNHSGLTANTKYYYKAWSYDGSDYSTGLTDDATTTVNTKLFISEIASTKDNDKARFVELYNAGSSTINFGEEIWYLSKKTNNGVWKETKLTGSVGPGDNFVIVKNATDYTTAYSLIGDQTSRIATNSNGDDSFYLYSGGDHDNGTLVDIYGDGTDGTGKAWDFKDSKAVRKRSVSEANTIWDASEWDIPSEANTTDMTPTEHKEDVSWQGTAGADWNTKGNNWSGTNHYIPDASFNVTILNTTNKPTISAESSCHNLTINTSSVLTINGEKSLNVFGTLTNSAGNTGLVLKADANGGASLIHNTNGVAATVETYFDLDRHYFISAPISNAVSNIFFDQYMFTWNEPNYSWDNFSGTTEALTPAKGFDVWNVDQSTVSYTGSLNNGNISISSLTKTNSGSGDPGFNLVGNPYPSVIDINELVFTDITAASYVFENSSAYLVWNQGTGGDLEARYIQPGQGFFAEVITTGATLPFTNAARVHNNLGPLDKKSTAVKSNAEVLILALQKEDRSRSDKTYIGFRDGATKDFDGYYDAKKLLGNKANSYVFSYLDKDLSQKMAINAFPTPYDDEVVPLGLMINEEGDYSLSFSNMDSFEAKPIFFVKDVLLKKVYDLQEDSIISFTYYKGQPEHRFDLYFKDIQEEDALDYQFVVYVNNNRIYLYSLAEFDANTKVEIYNIVGQKVYEDVLANMENGIPVKWTSSYYVIRLQDANNFYSEKFFIP